MREIVWSWTAAGRSLDGRTFYGTERAEDAAVSLVRLEEPLASAALVEVHTGVLWHLFLGARSAGRTRQHRSRLDFHGRHDNAGMASQRRCLLFSRFPGVGCTLATRLPSESSKDTYRP